MEFRAAVFPHGLVERAEIGEHRNHPRTGSWIFVVRGRNLEEAPRETQVAAKSCVPTNAFLLVERLLDQQLSASRVPGGINGQGLRGIGQPMLETSPQDRASWYFCFRNGAASILQRQISRARLRGRSENVIMVFQSCLTTWAEPDRGIVGLRELELVGVGGSWWELVGVGGSWWELVGCQSWMNLSRWKRQAPFSTFRWRS
jgi:hypothetical protein